MAPEAKSVPPKNRDCLWLAHRVVSILRSRSSFFRLFWLCRAGHYCSFTAVLRLVWSCNMMVRTAWVFCTAGLLSLSLSTANGPAGGFYFTRHQQRSRKVIAGQVQQQPHQLLEKSNRKEWLEGLLKGGLGRVASDAAAAFGGAAQDSRKAVEAAQSHHEEVPGIPGVAEEQGQQNTNRGFGRQWRSVSSPLEALSTTSRRLGQRASSTAAAFGSREGKQCSASLLTRGGASPARPPSTPPRQGDRWQNAIEGLKNGLASGLAAACVKTVLQPFDTMKTVQQFSTTR